MLGKRLKNLNFMTSYNSADRFKKIEFKLSFVPKSMNIVGTQLADLAAYPVARHVLHPQQPNLPFRTVQLLIFSQLKVMVLLTFLSMAMHLKSVQAVNVN